MNDHSSLIDLFAELKLRKRVWTMIWKISLWRNVLRNTSRRHLIRSNQQLVYFQYDVRCFPTKTRIRFGIELYSHIYISNYFPNQKTWNFWHVKVNWLMTADFSQYVILLGFFRVVSDGVTDTWCHKECWYSLHDVKSTFYGLVDKDRCFAWHIWPWCLRCRSVTQWRKHVTL